MWFGWVQNGGLMGKITELSIQCRVTVAVT